jgi:hypothetical protein
MEGLGQFLECPGRRVLRLDMIPMARVMPRSATPVRHAGQSSLARICFRWSMPIVATRIPREVESFIADTIESVGQLEILLLLHGDPSRIWTVAEINHELRSSAEAVGKRVILLVAKGLAERASESPPAYRYAARDAALDSRVRALQEAYRDYRTAVIEKIYAGPADRVMDFARSFSLRSRSGPPRPP